MTVPARLLGGAPASPPHAPFSGVTVQHSPPATLQRSGTASMSRPGLQRAGTSSFVRPGQLQVPKPALTHRAHGARGLAGVRKQLLEDINLLLEKHLSDEALAKARQFDESAATQKAPGHRNSRRTANYHQSHQLEDDGPRRGAALRRAGTKGLAHARAQVRVEEDLPRRDRPDEEEHAPDAAPPTEEADPEESQALEPEPRLRPLLCSRVVLQLGETGQQGNSFDAATTSEDAAANEEEKRFEVEPVEKESDEDGSEVPEIPAENEHSKSEIPTPSQSTQTPHSDADSRAAPGIARRPSYTAVSESTDAVSRRSWQTTDTTDEQGTKKSGKANDSEGVVLQHTASMSSIKADRTLSTGSLTRFQRATRAVIFSQRLKEVVRYQETIDDTPAISMSGSVMTSSEASDADVVSEMVSQPTTLSNISKLSICPVWIEDVSAAANRRRKLHLMSSEKSLSNTTAMRATRSETSRHNRSENFGERRTHRKCLDRLAFRPSSRFCVFWDIWTTLAIAYDMVQLPVSEAFDVTSSYLSTIELVTTVTWLSDMLLSFVRGYVDTGLGQVELNLRRIALHYIKTWFLLDACVVSIDVFVNYLQRTEWLKFFSFLRFFRLLRLLRVIRVLKVSARLSAMMESRSLLGLSGGSEKLGAMFKIVRQLLMLVVINHFIACGWYALGSKVDHGWVSDLVMGLEQAPVGQLPTKVYLYFTAFHWSITQFTPASMEVVAANTLERVFTICAIFLGLVMFSSFVSSMTQSMTHLRQLAMKETQSSLSVRKYISENQISSDLASKIIRCLKLNKATRRQRLKISDVDSFGTLPQSVLAQIQQEVFTPVICQHLAFGNLKTSDTSRYQRLCLDAVSERSVTRSEEVFLTGYKGEAMYFIIGGKLSYLYEDEFEEDAMAAPIDVNTGERASEMSLWAKWEHRGHLSALAHSELICVWAEAFQASVLASTLAAQFQLYARLFVQRSSICCGSAHAITDLWGSDEEVKEIAQRAFRKGFHTQASVDSFDDDDDDQFLMLLEEVFDAWKDATEANRPNWCFRFMRRRVQRLQKRPKWSRLPAGLSLPKTKTIDFL